ncbi:MAG: ABC transporter ATP-binding protein [Chthoniobacterales bacterium]
MSEPLLCLRDCSLRFGGLVALGGITLDIRHEELVGLIGPNGAGKTSVFNVITGVYRPTGGEVRFEGRLCNGLRPYRITAQGIARTFQNIRLFSSLSVLENVRAAFTLNLKHGILHALTRGPKFFAEEKQVHEEALHLLELFDLADKKDASCSALSYGDRRRLEIVRALATRPKLLLLDEPAAGMNSTEKTRLMELIRFVQKEFKIAVLLVEHDMKVVMGVCHRILVLDQGHLLAEGTPEQIQKDERVINAYLGRTTKK